MESRMESRAQNCTVIHFRTKNDSNGNPRQIYGVFYQGESLAFLDKGYHGVAVLDQWGKTVGEVLRQKIAMTIEISPKQYKELLYTHR